MAGSRRYGSHPQGGVQGAFPVTQRDCVISILYLSLQKKTQKRHDI